MLVISGVEVGRSVRAGMAVAGSSVGTSPTGVFCSAGLPGVHVGGITRGVEVSVGMMITTRVMVG